MDRPSRYVSTEPGWNSRLDEIQAAISAALKLRHLGGNGKKKLARVNAAKIRKAPRKRARHQHAHYAGRPTSNVFHQYTIRCNRRDALQKISWQTRKIGQHDLLSRAAAFATALRQLGAQTRRLFPNAEHVCRPAKILSLPMYPELTEEKIGRSRGRPWRNSRQS